MFQCDKWVASNGTCCPAGSRRENCPGQRLTCQNCNETGLRGYSVPVSQE